MSKVSVISPSFIEGFVSECRKRGFMEKEAAAMLNGYIDGAMHLSDQSTMEKKAAPMPFAKLLAENLKYGGHLFHKLFPKKFISNIPNIATKPLQWGGELANKHGWPGGVVGLLGATAAYGLPIYAFDKYRQSDALGASTMRALTGSGRIFGDSGSSYGIHDVPGLSGAAGASSSSGGGFATEPVPTSRDNIFTGPGRGEERDLPSLGIAIPAISRSRSASSSNGGITGDSFLGSDSEARAFGDLLNEREAIALELSRATEDANKVKDPDLRALSEKRIGGIKERQDSVNSRIRDAASTQGSRLAQLRADNSRALADLASDEANARRALNDNLSLYNRLHNGGMVAKAIGDALDSDSMFTNANRRGDELSEILARRKQLEEEGRRLGSFNPISVGF